MLFGGDKSKNSQSDDKKLPVPPVEQPPPYVYYTTPEEPRTPPSTIFTPTSPSFAPPPGPPPSNFNFIIKKHDAIKGTWNIDSSLPPPPSFLSLSGFSSNTDAEDDDRNPDANLYLKSTYGKIDAEVRVMSSRGVDLESPVAPARLECKSTHGKIRLGVLSYPYDRSLPGRSPIHITLRSTYGKLEVYLPRSFKGLIRSRTKHGKLEFSKDVSAHATTFSSNKSIASTFVGDWRSVDYSGMSGGGLESAVDGYSEKSDGDKDLSEGLDGWPVDLCILESEYGKITISYAKD